MILDLLIKRIERYKLFFYTANHVDPSSLFHFSEPIVTKQISTVTDSACLNSNPIPSCAVRAFIIMVESFLR